MIFKWKHKLKYSISSPYTLQWSLMFFLFLFCSSPIYLAFGQTVNSDPSPAPSPRPTAKPTTTPYQPPPNCINSKDELVYTNISGHGAPMISASGTILKCISNIPDPMLIPVFYNGKMNKIIQVNASIQLNNLHEVIY
jgi:hypothetical protein